MSDSSPSNNEVVSSTEIHNRVRRVIAQTFAMGIDDVDETASTSTIQAWDSVGQLELVMALEQEFRLNFSPEDILAVDSIENISTLLIDRGCN